MSDPTHTEPTTDSTGKPGTPSSPTGFGPSARALIGWIRPEEWLLFALWLFGFALCMSTGTGFDFRVIFDRYLRFFATYGLVLLGVTRVLFVVAESWRPESAVGRRVHGFAFGERRGLTSVVAIDLEFARGLILLFASLSVYSNIKVRIPAINPTIGDELFIQLDAMIFGSDFALGLEAWAQNDAGVSRFLADTYKHDYIWMVLLLSLAYVRRDAMAIRWIFGATCLTYITAILVTVGYPSLGPFYLERERLDWVNQSGVGGAQRFLTKFYNSNLAKLQAGEVIQGKAFAGIAAFPSLHIGHMIVMGWVSLRLAPLYAVWMLCITVVTFLATIAFGWHYAVDAIGGIAVAIGCTELVYQIVKRDGGRTRLLTERPWFRARFATPGAVDDGVAPASRG